MTLHELLARAHDLPERTLRHWTQHGLMPPANQRGHYEEHHLTRLFAIYRLRKEGVRKLDVLTKRLDAMSPEETQRFAYPEGEEDAAVTPGDAPVVRSDVPATPMDAPVRPTDAVIAQNGVATTPKDAATARADAATSQTWTHIELADGVLLLVREPMSEKAASLRQIITSLCEMTARAT